MWEIIKGNAFQVSSLCDNNETLIKCIWAPARAVSLLPLYPFPATPPRGLIAGFAMLKLFSSQSKQTHLREPSNSICALRGSPGSLINREPFHYTKQNRYVRMYFRPLPLRARDRGAISILRWKMRLFPLFFLSCRAIVNLGWIAEGNWTRYHPGAAFFLRSTP